MGWEQVLTIVASNVALIFVMIGTVIAIWLHQDRKLDDYRKNSDVDRREIVGLIKSIQDEVKDFHKRMCTIEVEKKAE